MRAPNNPGNTPLYEYTLMPAHMRHMFSVVELKNIELAEPFPFTKGVRTMKIADRFHNHQHNYKTLLFDLKNDPGQEHPIHDPDIEDMMEKHMKRLMRENDAPPEQFVRMGF
jgi:hypothetical protein